MSVLNQSIDIIKINIVLSMAIVVLSFYTIIWHNENRLLYRESNKVQKQNKQIIAMQKQLLSEYSEKISGTEIKEKAVNILQMQPVNPKKIRHVLL